MSGFRFQRGSKSSQSDTGAAFPYSDAELRLAAQAVRTSLLDALPGPSACQHTFSDRFLREMDALCRMVKRKERKREFVRRAAVIIITVLTGLSIWLAVDTDARAELIRWVRQTVEGWTEYRFFPRERTEMLPHYELYWLPDGYTKTPAITQEEKHVSYYENRETGDRFRFFYTFMGNGYGVAVPSEEIRTVAEVHGSHADFYEGVHSNTLIWMSGDLFFTLEGPLDSAAMCRIAENAGLRREDAPSWRPGWLPEGYWESRAADQTESGADFDVHYENDSGKTIHFLYYRMPSGELTLFPPSDWIRHDARPVGRTVPVHPEMELYDSPDGRYRLLVWLDVEERTAFYLYSEEPQNIVQRIAESIFREDRIDG